MAIENAKKFVEKVQADAALSEHVKGMKPEEGLALAKELGLEFTEAELMDALNNRELSPEELDEAAGGKISEFGRRAGQGPKCLAGEKHDWVKIGHREELHSFLWIDYTMGYDYYKCSKCGEEKRVGT